MLTPWLPVQEQYDKAGNKLEEAKDSVKDKYDDTQETIADKLATNPVEEAKAQGRIPADTETVLAAQK